MSSAPHIIKDFDLALSELKSDVLNMAAKTRHNLERAIQALLKRDRELANSVIADDDDVDDLERSIDKAGMELMVKYSPMASDLRFVVSSMKISMNLERISDHATNIAKRAKKIRSTTPELSDVPHSSSRSTRSRTSFFAMPFPPSAMATALSEPHSTSATRNSISSTRQQPPSSATRSRKSKVAPRNTCTSFSSSVRWSASVTLLATLARTPSTSEHAKDLRHMSRGDREV